jgi:hypothetical protein
LTRPGFHPRPDRTVVGTNFTEHLGAPDHQVTGDENVVDLAVRSVRRIGAAPNGPLPPSEGQSGKWAPEVEVSADNRSRGSVQPSGQAPVVKWCERKVVGGMESRHRDGPRIPDIDLDAQCPPSPSRVQ